MRRLRLLDAEMFLQAEGYTSTPDGKSKRLMSFPAEILLIVFEYLTQIDIKQLRLVCKRLRDLSVGKLFHVLYISPREEDMAVFDAVTQRPDLNVSIVNICFETARFIQEPTMEQYFDALSAQLRSDPYSHLRANDTAVQKQCELMDGREGFDSYYRNPIFFDGYQRYLSMAKEHQNYFTQPWFVRVLQGLQALRSVNQLEFINTFDIYYERNYYGNELREITRHVEVKNLRDFTGNNAFDATRKRPVGSPSSRSWPLVNLQPTNPVLNACEVASTHSKTDGSVEMIRAVELIKLAAKTPHAISYNYVSHYENPSDHMERVNGLPPQLFALERWWGQTKLSDICEHLSILELYLASHTDLWVAHQPQMLHQLKDLFWRMPKLEELVLILPSDDPLHHFQDIFPPVIEWQMPRLRELRLEAVLTSYEEFMGLLFIVFPSLDILDLQTIRLVNGDWGSIIEGLWKMHSLSICLVGGLEYIDGRDYFPCGRDDYTVDEYLAFMEKIGDYIIRKDSDLNSQDGLLSKDDELSTSRFTETYNRILALRSKKNVTDLGVH
ncbi:MAG: hypothetical protein Q9204_003999 [Flavoplaca sp. TL-2023a]